MKTTTILFVCAFLAAISFVELYRGYRYYKYNGPRNSGFLFIVIIPGIVMSILGFCAAVISFFTLYKF